MNFLAIDVINHRTDLRAAAPVRSDRQLSLESLRHFGSGASGIISNIPVNQVVERLGPNRSIVLEFLGSELLNCFSSSQELVAKQLNPTRDLSEVHIDIHEESFWHLNLHDIEALEASRDDVDTRSGALNANHET